MGKPEAMESGEEDFIGPEPPPLGSAAYRRIILNICATHTTADYDAALLPVWQWRGWRAGVEVMVEIIGALSVNLWPGAVDAYGNVRLNDKVRAMDDDHILRHAAATAPESYPDLPPHEALASAIRDGEEMRDLVDSLLPYWNEAATLLRADATTEGMEKGRVLFTRWLNKHYKDRRLWAANLGASATHSYWRAKAMPLGNAWIEDVVTAAPHLRRSAFYTAEAAAADMAQRQPVLVDAWRSPDDDAGARRAKPVKGGKKRPKGRCCPNCGRRKHT